MATPVVVDETTFPQTVLASAIPVVVEFTADWCPPCKLLAPVLRELSVEYAGALLFTEVDTDAEPDLVARYGVLAMPTLIFFQQGQEVHRLVGYVPKGPLTRYINGMLGRGPA